MSSVWDDIEAHDQAAELPTSAQLRKVQQSLAVSQADLTSTRASIVELLGILHRFQVAAGGDPNISYAGSAELIVMQRAELASARQELAQLRGVHDWDVATAYVHDCGFCRWSIQRGEAFKPMPGAKGSFVHIRCPKDPR